MKTVTYTCDCCEKQIKSGGVRVDVDVKVDGLPWNTTHYHQKCYGKATKIFNKACDQVSGVS